MSFTRRTMLKGSTAFALGGLLGTGVSPVFASSDMKGKSLRVATYGGSWRDAVANHIATPLVEAGATVDYEVGNPDDNIAKLIAAKRQGQVPFDVFDGSSLTYPEAFKAGFFEEIDYSAIPNAANLPEFARYPGQVMTTWAPEGIVYNEERFKEAGIPAPQKYSDLKDPRLKGHVAFPLPVHVHHWSAVVGLAFEKGGNEENLLPALDEVKEIDPAYFFSSSVELSTRFASGEIWAAPWGAGWAVRLKRAGEPIAVAYQPYGDRKGTMWPGPTSIIKGTPNSEAALAFLAQWFTVDGPAQFASATGSLPIGSEARAKLVNEDPLAKSMLLWSDEQIDNNYWINWEKLDAKQWRETWGRTIRA